MVAKTLLPINHIQKVAKTIKANKNNQKCNRFFDQDYLDYFPVHLINDSDNESKKKTDEIHQSNYWCELWLDLSNF